MPRPLISLLIFLLLATPAYAASHPGATPHACIDLDSFGGSHFPARVVAVADGDTITVEPIQGGDRVRVRLQGIDAPEINQPYGQAARAFVSEAVLYKEVHLASERNDRYGRIVAVVEVPGAGVLQELLLEAGLAWVWPQFCRDCGEWKALEEAARGQGLGLWADESPVPPWEWRRK